MGPHGAKRGPREAEWETETIEMFAVPFPLHIQGVPTPYKQQIGQYVVY